MESRRRLALKIKPKCSKKVSCEGFSVKWSTSTEHYAGAIYSWELESLIGDPPRSTTVLAGLSDSRLYEKYFSLLYI